MSEDGIQEVFDRINSPERTKVPNMEYVKDVDGKIVDVIFSSDKDVASLKKLLPGTYLILVETEGDPKSPGPGAGYSSPRDQVELEVYKFPGGEKSGAFFASLLHEAGHAAMFSEGNIEMFDAAVQNESVGTRYDLLYELMENNGLTPESIEDIRQNNFEPMISFYRMPDQFARSLRKDFKKAVEDMGILSPEKQDTYKIELEQEFALSNLRYIRVSERGAWAKALRAVRELKRLGIANFSESDFIDFTDDALATYQNAVSEDLINCISPHERILRKSTRNIKST